MAVVFERVELDYGRHGGVFRFAEAADPARAGRPANGSGKGSGNGAGNGRHGASPGSPFVVVGPNGSGKSTLVEAPVRVLFGFRRNRKDGREAHAQRKPWVGGPYRALLVLRTTAGRFTFERDFETDRVRVRKEGKAAPLFDAEANPARTGEAVRQYRSLLREIVGLDSFDHYRDTACVFQGGLLTTGLSVELLRIAAGGHTDVESAYARLRQEYAVITVEPIAPAISRRRKPGMLEELTDRIEELELRAREARAAEEARRPLVRARDERVARLETLSDETERLEAAFETLSEGERLETEIEAARARVRGLESAAHDLDEALAAFTLVRARDEAHPSGYPRDFAERARALEEGLWPRLATVATEAGRLREAEAEGVPESPRRGWVAVGAFVALLGVVALALGATAVGALALAAGAASGAASHVRRRALESEAAHRRERLADLEREGEELETRIGGLTADVPGGDDLRPETLPAARREFEREEADRRLLADSEGALRVAVDAAARAIALHDSARDEAEDAAGADAVGREEPAHPDGVPAGAGRLVERARDRLASLHEAIARQRDDHMAPLRLRLNQLAKVRFDLPEGVDARLEDVRLARRARLAEAAELQARVSGLERELAAEGRVEASALSFERELDELRERAGTLAARAAAYRSAYSYVAEAYEAFRTTDEERLLGAISSHLEAVSNGALGPLETEGGLDTATVRVADRSLPLTSPPLSYGQLHAALLAIRLGAADFLAGLGVGLPLMIDDPFVHLDERGVADVWAVLETIARERQVIVATQDRLVLDHLGVRADLELDPGAGATSRPPSTAVPRTADPEGPDDPAAGPRATRVDDAVLDLWSDAGD
ncbi:MAG: AAA family ATPase [Gemmatimonadota bacterium]|nr:AAA family ATPase [Gemmatimonadota bacterium]